MKAILRRCRSGPFFPQALVGGLLPAGAGAGLTAGGRIKGNGSTGQVDRRDLHPRPTWPPGGFNAQKLGQTRGLGKVFGVPGTRLEEDNVLGTF